MPERSAAYTGIYYNREGFIGRAIVAIVFLFFVFLVLEAPLRWFFSLHGLDFFIYIPKIFVLALVILAPLMCRRLRFSYLFLMSLTALAAILGFVNLSSKPQIIFGLWVVVPFLFGAWLGTSYKGDEFKNIFFFLFLLAVSGVFLEPFFPYPWSGLSVEIAGLEIEAARSWTTFGVERYAGFSRASYNVAAQLLILSTFLVFYAKKRMLKITIWIAAGVGIFLTTTKGAFVTWVILSFFFLSGWLFSWGALWKKFWIFLLAVFLLLMIMLPLSTLFMGYTLEKYQGDQLLFSFSERLTRMWPETLGLLEHNAAGELLGRGIGGVGTAQTYFETGNGYPADNFFVYLSVVFGIPITLFLFFLFWLRFAVLGLGRRSFFLIAIAIICSLYGLVINVIEEPLLSFALGFSVVGYGSAGWRESTPSAARFSSGNS